MFEFASAQLMLCTCSLCTHGPTWHGSTRWYLVSSEPTASETLDLSAAGSDDVACPQDCSILSSMGHMPIECKGLMLIVPGFR